MKISAQSSHVTIDNFSYIWAIISSHHNSTYYFLVTHVRKRTILFSAVDIIGSSVSYIYSVPSFSGSVKSPTQFNMLAYHLHCHQVIITQILSVLSLNLTALSLYIWLECNIFLEEKGFVITATKSSLELKYENLYSKNKLRRYLILKYL